MRRLFLLAIVVLGWGGFALAQQTVTPVMPGAVGNFLPNGPTAPMWFLGAANSASEAICQGGGGSNVTSVGTTAITVCAAGTTRTMWKLNVTGTGTVYVTDDGTTPTAATATDTIVGPGQRIYTTPNYVSPAIIQAVGSVAGITIKAVAVQTGAAP